MMRDHYRAWGINNKNNRRESRRAEQQTITTSHRDPRARPDEALLARPDHDPLSAFFRHEEDAIYFHSPEIAYERIEDDLRGLRRNETHLLHRAALATNLQSPLYLTGEMLFLHTTLKGLQSWSNSFYELEARSNDVLPQTNEFHDYLWDMKNAIRILEAERMCSQASVRRLSQAGVKLIDCFQRSCTPLAVLMSLQPVIEFRSNVRSDDLPWGEAASQFLLQIAASTFGCSHPVLMLLQQLTFGKRDPEVLAAIYESGRRVVGRCADGCAVLRFQTSFFQTVFTLGLDTAFEPHIDVLSAEASNDIDVPDARVLCDLAHLHLRRLRFRQAVQISRACLSAIKTQSGPDWIARNVLRTMASAQSAEGDYEGAMSSLHQALALVTINQSEPASVPRTLSSSSMMVVDDLRQLYKLRGELDKYATLRLQYPTAFDD